MADAAAQNPSGPRYRPWLAGSFLFIAALIIVRFFLEVLGTPHQLTEFLSSTGAVYLVAIYLGAVAPLRGFRRSWRIVLPGILLAAWTQGWVILFTIISGALHLQRSHFAEPQDWGNWGHLMHHVLDHLAEIVPVAIVVLVLMAAVLVLWRWPVTVGPGAVLGALVVIRFWSETMQMAPVVSSAWSSTVAFLLCGLFLGGIGSLVGISSRHKLLVPALVLGWAWRFWVFVAVLMASAFPYMKTHYFSGTHAHPLIYLLRFLAVEVILVGFIAGLIEWGIATWMAGALRLPKTE